MAEEEDDVFDVIVIGGGVAGAVCAYRLAGEGHQVVLIERGAEPGGKNLSGGIFYCRVMEQVFPGFVERAPVERVITRNVISFLNPASHVDIDYWDQRLAEPANAVSVLRARLDAWLVEQCEEAGVMVLPATKVDRLLFSDEGDAPGAGSAAPGAAGSGRRVVGVVAGEDELRARVVVAADGVNSFIAQEAGIRAKEPPKHLAVGVKSVVRLGEDRLQERFHTAAGEGVAYAVVGDATQACAGGGFLYTNGDSVSVGVVLRLDDLAARGLSSSDVHDHFLSHPAIAPLLEGGELLEYGCHLTIEDGPEMASHDLTRPGLVIIGDAAGFTLNTGLTIRGMDLAAGSALAAATAIHAALEAGDFSQASMDRYLTELRASFVGADMELYRRAPKFLETPRMYRDYGLVLADVLHGVFDLDTTPRRHLLAVARAALKRSGIAVTTLARDGWAAIRAL